MRTALALITDALQVARVPNFTAQALDELNSILSHICRTIDFSAARRVFNFYFSTNLVSSGQGNIVTASSNPLPIDYLRVGVSGGSTGSQRSSKWYIQGVPYDMVEIDLTEWDDQVQQAGIQSYPYFWAKDMAQRQIVANIVGDLNAASQYVNNVSALTNILVGMSVAGGIGPLSVVVPGTTVLALVPSLVTTGDTHTSTLLDSIPSTAELVVGQGVSGTGIPIGANISLINSSTSVTLTQAATATASSVAITFANMLELSAAPTATLPAATLMVGNPPVAYPYPPPAGAYPVMLRYQAIMPDLTQAQVNAGAYCWFDDDLAIRDALIGQMLGYSYIGQTNAVEYIGSGLGSGEGRFGKRMEQYLKLADDNANRAQTVQLDRRVFGRSFSALKNTKTVGWMVLLCMGFALSFRT